MHVLPRSESSFAHIIPAYLQGQLFYSLNAEMPSNYLNN